MKIVTTVRGMQALSDAWKAKGLSIGLVPTMGALHEGHLSLVQALRLENDVCVLSLFVNPIQFGPKEDFRKYPRPVRRDQRLARQCGVDVLFMPTVKEMYPNKSGLRGGPYQGTQIFPPSDLTDRLCGRFRPGHFTGVATVVAKLFHAVMPDRAYFGQKDAQQCAVIRRMVKELNWPLSIRILPIIRESDGLAKSSRNVYLNLRERSAARVLYQTLKVCERLIKNGERDPQALRRTAAALIRKEPLARLEYAEVVDPDSLETPRKVNKTVMVALAVHIGRTRLIDNMIYRML